MTKIHNSLVDEQLHNVSEAVLRRAAYLPAAERTLIEQVYGRGVPVADLARIHGENPRVVQRRVRFLVARLTDRRVVRVLRDCRRWERNRRAVALRWWLARRSQPRIAAELGLSVYQVRQHLFAISALIEEEGEESKESPRRVQGESKMSLGPV